MNEILLTNALVNVGEWYALCGMVCLFFAIILEKKKGAKEKSK